MHPAGGMDMPLPRPRLRIIDAVAIVIGVVVGAGIFRAPGPVAAGADSALGVATLWGLGGLLSMVGALCYAELACAFPSAGGEYHFLSRAFGGKLAFLFAWSRLAVTSTGSIALLAFVFGDYASHLLPLGPHSSALYAGAVVAVLTGLNALGLRFGCGVQNAFTGLVVLGLVALVAAGLTGEAQPAPAPPESATSTVGLAMIFVLLTYGGWNEAAYLSAEVRGGKRSMALAVLLGVAAVSALYLLINLAFLRVLGLEGVRSSQTVGADMMEAIAGPRGARLASALIAAATFTSINATIVTGARGSYALGRDFRIFRGLGRWNDKVAAPVSALWVQGAIVLALVGLGAAGRRGFETMVEYTAPVFWAFFFLTGLSLFVLRIKEPSQRRPFRVPLYPLTPLIFCGSCLWLLHASLAHTRLGALVGIGALAVGLVPLWIERRSFNPHSQENTS